MENSTFPKITVQENPVIEAVQVSFSACLKNQLQEAINTVALHGGYFEEPPFALDKEFTENKTNKIPYYFFNEKDIAPSREIVETQLALALQDRVNECTNFSAYPYSVSAHSENTQVTTKITETKVAATILFPLEIQTENAVSSLDTFSIEISSSFFTLYSAALAMTTEQALHPSSVCMTCLTQFATDAQAYLGIIELQSENKQAILYILNDRDNEFENHLSFYFAHGFLTDAIISESSKQKVSITPLDKQVAKIGYTYKYQVLAQGKNILFSDNSPLFDIDPKIGIISFTPNQNDIGSRIVTITATDDENNKAETSFIFEVIDVVSSEISLEPLPYFVAHVNQEFNYTVGFTANQSAYFLDNTDLFDIHLNTGLINFIPTSSQIGTYNFTITLIDELGKSDTQNGYMVITK